MLEKQVRQRTALKEKYPKDPPVPSRVPRDPETGNYTDCAARIREIYARNCFMADYFHIDIDEIHCGSAVVSLQLDPERHTDDGEFVGGDVLSALADAVLGVTGASLGERVVTVMSSMNFVRPVRAEGRLYCRSRVAHHGRTTMDIESRMYDDDGRLVMSMLSVMMNVGKFEGIPAKW